MLRNPPDWRRAPPIPIPPRIPPPNRDTQCSLNILRSDPASASLTSSTSLPYPPPPRSKSSSLSGEDEDEEKRHVCMVCNKAFNRPSSLRIHINTHTGATPFRCPFPGCGRGFNVNSNMRRHYRNHTNSAFVPKYPSSWRVFRPHKNIPIPINRSEYVWHPPSSSSASSDNEEESRDKRRPGTPYRLSFEESVMDQRCIGSPYARKH
ncbi:uncharacterized protein EV420DRAFT_1569499 [Desarmillaria tabescens]|uniref:C2H2-type domain-containing protein n=1 Tax=Armillaria tabescens TaxID=1929756 RepID=A0AA39JQN3_ARMTA|nr:uncharacterized protein EV420DRAFT_1569499 [Desarmillaria tabescens]KAK0447023.1 hypothetical protein EV420DRAFT_1569499 [Desarmillaria tabescens]